ncbi:DUF2723 domain-containing protein [Chryseobacterium sp. FH1]|uniref:glycosyltransferase family 117 protein n=1 Tax=Chryseobacterium sp. FH1 TaxID=1233951 RepID=UPI0004E44696|nr:DUF2723 domain-containing protein [Chryseobacterium sp. FH1]KFC20167.1 glycosyltransferase [Chryseobacterium sp. FH1]
MKNWTFKQWNTILGWVVFAIAFLTYLSTIEPNFSFWDCGEYISSAVKLEVTHAPGAALFQLIGAVVALFAFGDGQNYSLVINAMSALCSAFTILFLFWTITHLVRRLLNKEFENITVAEEIATLFAGGVGALCFTFSDSFWFSAVEGEVYAMASMFIALIVWLITKWENEYLEKDNERWIILLFFIVGLSVGVHMMCMLALPAVCLIYYTRNYKFTWKSFLIANAVTLLILVIVFKIIFPVIMTLFGKSEVFFVNGLGLPFHSGTVFAFVILIVLCYLFITYTRKTGKSLYQTIALSVVYMMIGFSCWLVIPIRAIANPPMNLNDPDNALGMLDYYNREQYGDWPTLYGQNYTAYLDPNGIQKNEDGSYKTVKTGDTYEKDPATGRYRLVGEKFNYVYNPEHVSLFPRMFSEDKSVMPNYISMYGAPDFTFNYGNEQVSESPEAKQFFDELRQKYENGTIKMDDYLKAKQFGLINVQRPTLAQNLDYFITFQNYFYFVRYLLWNYSGRQNDVEGHMENTNGNFITGIPFIDNNLWGDQSEMPAKFQNASTVKFFMLPLILGLIGFFFQLNRDFGRFYSILSLFILTSVMIVFYTGMKPFEPRERDYAMVGSFYAFAIWIGLGVAAIYWFLQKKVQSKGAQVLVGAALMGIPLMMAFQNYNVHDRSNRYAAYDYAYSSLKSLPKDGIMFVYGDNDTYPVWAIQETEEFRSDVKVVNFTLLSTPWNIDQVKRRTYNAMGVPSTLVHEDYREGSNDQIYMMSKDDWSNIFANLKDQGVPDTEFAQFRKFATQDSITLKEAISFLKMKSPEKDEIVKMIFGEERYQKFNFLPVTKFVLPVNVNNAVKAGIITPAEAQKAEKQIVINYKGTSMFKNNLLMMDILANFDWKRSINFSSGGIYDPSNLFFLSNYLKYDGHSYRLVPIKTEESVDGELGMVNADELYNTVKNYKWGNFKDLNTHFDETCTQNIVSYRSSASRVAEALVLKGEKNKAIEILDLANREIPVSKYNDPRSLSSIVYAYIVAGQEQKGLELAEDLKKGIFAEYDYYTRLSPKFQVYAGRQMKTKPMEYSLVVGAVADAYNKIGQKDKGYQYLVNSLNVIDKRFDVFIKDLQEMGKEKAFKKADDVQKVTSFYSYLFDIMKDYDTTYEAEKMDQITKKLMKVTQ